MTRWIGGGLAVALALSLPGAASAQDLRQGLPLEALVGVAAAHDLTMPAVTVPDEADLPVRVAFVDAVDGGPAALFDVRVLGSSAEAVAWARHRASTVAARGTRPYGRGTWVIEATGRASVVVLARDNVAIVVRGIAQRTFAVDELIADLTAAILGAPLGAPAAPSAGSVEVPPDLAVGASHPVQIPPGLVATRIVASGAGYARRTPAGWMITRTGEGAIDARIVGVDALLRAVR